MAIPVTFLKGVKGARAQALQTLGVVTLEDLSLLIPRSYEDRTLQKPIAALAAGDEVRVRALILRTDFREIRKNLCVLNLRIADESGEMTVTFYNQRYLKARFIKGETYCFFGKITRGYYGPELCNPAFTENPNDPEFSSIKPVYPLSKGLTQNLLRKIVQDALALLPPFPETLPEDILKTYHLPGRDDAIRTLHAPDSAANAEKARKRLAFEELFTVQIMLMQLRAAYGTDRGGICFHETPRTDELIRSLSFTLSPSQQKVWAEIRTDMASEKPMNRLVLGDVGSGKTILAVLAMLEAADNGYQAAYMAPTEILAEQHYANLSAYLKPFGIEPLLLTGSLSSASRQKALASIADGSARCVIGTHALIQNKVCFKNPGLMITDEQHRFGVRQRTLLADQATRPDILVMTATPIPRTLGLILYGDMDISRIDALPSGRLPIRTFVENDARRERIYKWAAELVREGRQVYIVHPLVEEGENPETEALLSATQNYEKLSGSVFRNIPCGLVHGKMPAKEKDGIMRAFAAGTIKILFATTVIEVGVDVPNAVLMIVENAERFGLAQLHQLRGRVGRGSVQSYCVLFTDAPLAKNPAPDDIVGKRMQIMKTCTDGFRISEKDLEIRGPGDFFGTQQHGLPQFRVANLYEDTDVLRQAQEAAQTVLTDSARYSAYLEQIRQRIPTLISL